jgi:hypothetical protein
MNEQIKLKYFECLDKANNLNIAEFIFEHENFHYIVKWQGLKWSEPNKILKL